MLLLKLFRWNAINIRMLAFSYACVMLCSDMLITARGLHAACSVTLCQVSTVVVHTWGKEQLE